MFANEMKVLWAIMFCGVFKFCALCAIDPFVKDSVKVYVSISPCSCGAFELRMCNSDIRFSLIKFAFNFIYFFFYINYRNISLC